MFCRNYRDIHLHKVVLIIPKQELIHIFFYYIQLTYSHFCEVITIGDKPLMTRKTMTKMTIDNENITVCYSHGTNRCRMLALLVRQFHCRLIITGPPTHSAGGQTITISGVWRRLSSSFVVYRRL